MAEAGALGLAICIAGEPRSFTLPCVHRSLRTRVVSPLLLAGEHNLSLLLLFKSAEHGDDGRSGVSWVQGRPPSAEVLELNRMAGRTRSNLSQQPDEAALLRATALLCKDVRDCHVRTLPPPPTPTAGRDLCGLSAPCTIDGAPSPSTERFLAQQVTWDACLTAVEELERWVDDPSPVR